MYRIQKESDIVEVYIYLCLDRCYFDIKILCKNGKIYSPLNTYTMEVFKMLTDITDYNIQNIKFHISTYSLRDIQNDKKFTKYGYLRKKKLRKFRIVNEEERNLERS